MRKKEIIVALYLNPSLKREKIERAIISFFIFHSIKNRKRGVGWRPVTVHLSDEPNELPNTPDIFFVDPEYAYVLTFTVAKESHLIGFEVDVDKFFIEKRFNMLVDDKKRV